MSAATIKEQLEVLQRQGDSWLDAYVASFLNTAEKETVRAALHACQFPVNGQWQLLPKALASLEQEAGRYCNLLLSEGAKATNKQLHDRLGGNLYLVLGLYSLPYCYLSADGARTLAQSRRLLKEPVQRLAETAGFVRQMACAADFDHSSLSIALFRVRLAHTLARQLSLLHGAGAYMSVNMLEVMGTGIAFGLVMLRGLRKMGISISQQETNAWLELWHAVSVALGVPSITTIADAKSAWLWEQHISATCFQPSDEAILLTTSFVRALDDQLTASIPGKIALNGIGGSTAPAIAWFIGPDARLLGIRQPRQSSLATPLRGLGAAMTWMYNGA